MRGNTKNHKKYWANRKIDWRQAYWNPEHPHRNMIIGELHRRFNFGSIYELGCGAGANLGLIQQYFKNVEIGGIDINPDAIQTAKELLPTAKILDVGEITDVYFSDKSIDIVMTDAALIYLDKKNIHKAMKEISRIARNGALFCEFHSERWWERLIMRLGGGYNIYNYKKLLPKYGFKNIEIVKIPKQIWDGMPWVRYGYIITAEI